MPSLRLLSIALVVTVGAAAAVRAAAPVPLNVNLGLWTIKSVGQVNGDLAAAAASQLQGLSATQKKMAEAMMANIAKAITAPITYQQCLTAKDLANGFKPDPNADKNGCTETLVSSSPTALDATIVCTGQDKVDGTMHFDAPSPDAMTGTIDMTVSVQGVGLQITRQLQGSWVSADCGKVKP